VQLFAFYVWSRSQPGTVGTDALRTALADLLAQVSPRAEDIWYSATPIQRRLLIAIAALAGGTAEVSGREFLHRAGFKGNASALAAARPFLTGRDPLLEKYGAASGTGSGGCACGYCGTIITVFEADPASVPVMHPCKMAVKSPFCAPEWRLRHHSAQKLRRQGVNLLGERAAHMHMHPYMAVELGTSATWRGFAR